MVKSKWIVGIDEVGRGPLAGPVAVCACALREVNYKKSIWEGLTDSKKLSSKSREKWFQEARNLKNSGTIKYSVVYRGNLSIDKKGISLSIRECIARALKNLKLKPGECQVLLDGSLYAPKEYKNQKTIIKGDQKEKIISLASVIAKVSRDKKMELLHKKYPIYGWNKNKGYGTREHYLAIKAHGLTPLHRISFLTKV